MTGVTALVRATAYLMERDGITSPAEYIGDWLREADILHISNEIPFASNCPFPDPQQAGLRFCSAPRYIKLLEEIGTDVVELTGDHFADWGADATLYTLEMYRERGWPYYGGGRISRMLASRSFSSTMGTGSLSSAAMGKAGDMRPHAKTRQGRWRAIMIGCMLRSPGCERKASCPLSLSSMWKCMRTTYRPMCAMIS
jgi:hypothetical protein